MREHIRKGPRHPLHVPAGGVLRLCEQESWCFGWLAPRRWRRSSLLLELEADLGLEVELVVLQDAVYELVGALVLVLVGDGGRRRHELPRAGVLHCCCSRAARTWRFAAAGCRS